MKIKHFFLLFSFLLLILTACQENEMEEVNQDVLKHAELVDIPEGERGDVREPNPDNNPCDVDETDLRILFIGNSHTDNYTVDLAQLFEDLAVHNMQDVDLVDVAAVNGFTLANHLSYAPTMNKVNQGNWDYVILQENSGYLSQGNYAGFGASVNSFVNILANGSPDVKIVLYQVVPPWHHNSTTYSNLFTTWNSVFANIANNYSHMYVCNIGRAFTNAYNGNFGYNVNNPDYLRYDATFSFHYANAGSFLTAVAFYAAIFNNKPCLPTSMYFYQGPGFGYSPVASYVDQYHKLAQIGYMVGRYSVHPSFGVGHKCNFSYPTGGYPCE